MNKETAEILLKINAVSLRTNPPFRWVSGIVAPIYTDNRLFMSYPKERNFIVDKFLQTITDNKLHADVIAGIATSGIPWAAWVADRLNLPMVYIRKKQKSHGKENLIEGKLDKGKKVLIIEDLISTGGSSINGVEAVRAAGCSVEACLAIFTYGLEKAHAAFKTADVKLFTLTDFTTLVKVAVETGYLDKGEKENVMEWKNNPQEWGKKCL
jgi:orotate phosphoribosyltransferase